jgi:hypothetical protein
MTASSSEHPLVLEVASAACTTKLSLGAAVDSTERSSGSEERSQVDDDWRLMTAAPVTNVEPS